MSDVAITGLTRMDALRARSLAWLPHLPRVMLVGGAAFTLFAAASIWFSMGMYGPEVTDAQHEQAKMWGQVFSLLVGASIIPMYGMLAALFLSGSAVGAKMTPWSARAKQRDRFLSAQFDGLDRIRLEDILRVAGPSRTASAGLLFRHYERARDEDIPLDVRHALSRYIGILRAAQGLPPAGDGGAPQPRCEAIPRRLARHVRHLREEGAAA